MRNRILPLLPLLWIVVSPRCAVAWGNEGHKIVCEIAFQRLTDEARDLVLKLRAADPDRLSSFAEDCLWADRVIQTEEFEKTRAFHFINIPASADGVNMAEHCGDTEKRCAPWAIREFGTILANSPGITLQRAQALKFLAHFVGDLHQPLHAGFPGDLGGNTIRVTFMGDKNRKLHAVWDTSVLSVAGIRFPAGAITVADPIDETDIAAWSNFEVLAWTNEAYHFAESHAYTLKSGEEVEGGDELAEAYHFRSLEVVKKQLQRAGVRLAFLINRAALGEANFPEF